MLSISGYHIPLRRLSHQGSRAHDFTCPCGHPLLPALGPCIKRPYMDKQPKMYRNLPLCLVERDLIVSRTLGHQDRTELAPGPQGRYLWELACSREGTVASPSLLPQGLSEGLI